LINLTLVLSAIGSMMILLMSLYIKYKYEQIQKRKRALIKLDGYLTEIYNDIMDNDFVKEIFSFGISSEKKLKSEKNIKKRKEISINIDEECNNFYKLIENPNIHINTLLENLFNAIKQSEEFYQFEKKEMEYSRDLIMNNKIYISDEDSTYLDLETSKYSILFKSLYFEIAKRYIYLLIKLHNMKTYDYNELKEDIRGIVLHIIRYSKVYYNLHINIEKNKTFYKLI